MRAKSFHLSVLFCVLTTLHVCKADEAQRLVIGLIGDSTVCDYAKESPQRGWGQMLEELTLDGTVIVNRARGGESTLSFPPKNWEEVKAARPNYVFIQFGHNDMKKHDPTRFAAPTTSYRDHLKRYIREAREIGATPVLVTPVSRRTYRDGIVTTELLPYADAVKVVGQEMEVAVIDLNALSRERFQNLGEKGSEGYTMNKLLKPDAEHPDRTHFTELGAREMAKLVAAEFFRVDQRLVQIRKTHKD